MAQCIGTIKNIELPLFENLLVNRDEFDLHAKLGYFFDKMFQKHKKRRRNLSKF